MRTSRSRLRICAGWSGNHDLGDTREGPRAEAFPRARQAPDSDLAYPSRILARHLGLQQCWSLTKANKSAFRQLFVGFTAHRIDHCDLSWCVGHASIARLRLLYFGRSCVNRKEILARRRSHGLLKGGRAYNHNAGAFMWLAVPSSTSHATFKASSGLILEARAVGGRRRPDDTLECGAECLEGAVAALLGYIA
jgi:hypothetical protein